MTKLKLVMIGLGSAMLYAALAAILGITLIEYIAGCGMPEIGGACVIVGD